MQGTWGNMGHHRTWGIWVSMEGTAYPATITAGVCSTSPPPQLGLHGSWGQHGELGQNGWGGEGQHPPTHPPPHTRHHPALPGRPARPNHPTQDLTIRPKPPTHTATSLTASSFSAVDTGVSQPTCSQPTQSKQHTRQTQSALH